MKPTLCLIGDDCHKCVNPKVCAQYDYMSAMMKEFGRITGEMIDQEVIGLMLDGSEIDMIERQEGA